MREIYDYSGHPLLDQLEEAISEIVQLLDRHGYSDQALYIAQECLIDELIGLEQTAQELKTQGKKLRMQAAQLAKGAKDARGHLSDAEKEESRRLYQNAQEHEDSRRVLQYGRWLLRYVGDGIAWHAFAHNRRLIRALASKESVPAIPDLAGVVKVRRMFRAVRRLGRNWFPVLHDITNCLRTADLSVFRDGHLVDMLELKFRIGAPKANEGAAYETRLDSRSQRQGERMDRILRFLETKELGDLDPKLAGGKAIDSEVPERHNFDAVSRALAQARKAGYGIDSPEPGVIYVAWNVQKNDVESALSAAGAQHPEIVASTITFRSVSARYDDHHQGLPITAMALPAADILDILFGRFGVVAIVNLRMLEAYCLERGVPLKMIKSAPRGFSLQVEVDGIGGEVQDGLWDRVMLEALSMESFVGLVRSIMRAYPSRDTGASA